MHFQDENDPFLMANNPLRLMIFLEKWIGNYGKIFKNDYSVLELFA